ncbi:uncharacterized protein J7T54_000123 [Emericellopsis cladophorae]|uniref:Uncharacterized protein n=1 Tax=Emericellopsis cladophorae TaxID=2686198 RepID=A0A9Q0BDS2_9HYPO|nr:uncharacterized protein J7T54_000123 [Emericellopsis cladophorae]KAI6780484.1 hypothetical protein J7T54_000123 [Emericellopsis cladophorae]
MPGRTISNSSERSIASDDNIEDRAHSGRSTPTPGYQLRRYPTSNNMQTHQSWHSSALPAPILMAEPAAASREAFSLNNHSSTNSRPVAIDLPAKARNFNSAPVYTPPEPLSARGNLPGGYFPLHEDPERRVHQPHPFQAAGTDPSRALATSEPQPRQHQLISPSKMSATDVPIASYFPSGYHDDPLPMGKYYPSNYERSTSHTTRNLSATPSSPADARSPGFSGPDGPTSLSSTHRSSGLEPEARRQLQLKQYQRDMMAQASRAASEVMSRSAEGQGAAKVQPTAPPFGTLTSPCIHTVEMRFAPHKPTSPRLHPLGSPGPVTPMELESSGSSYLDKGKGQGQRTSQGLAPPSSAFH